MRRGWQDIVKAGFVCWLPLAQSVVVSEREPLFSDTLLSFSPGSHAAAQKCLSEYEALRNACLLLSPDVLSFFCAAISALAPLLTHPKTNPGTYHMIMSYPSIRSPIFLTNINLQPVVHERSEKEGTPLCPVPFYCSDAWEIPQPLLLKQPYTDCHSYPDRYRKRRYSTEITNLF